MKLCYSNDSKPNLKNTKSIFLVGPTPRSIDVKSWRPEAIEIAKNLQFDGMLLIPEWSEWNKYPSNYIDQVMWERHGLDNCTAILAWVPRNMKDMPALTTNVEFGRYVTSGKLFYGRPVDAPHISYLDWLYQYETKRYPCSSLEYLFKQVLDFVNKGNL